jgi:hypothetical protein
LRSIGGKRESAPYNPAILSAELAALKNEAEILAEQPDGVEEGWTQYRLVG